MRCSRRVAQAQPGSAVILTAPVSRPNRAVRMTALPRNVSTRPFPARLLLQTEAPSTIRAWFSGMNPELDDRAPALVLADDAPRVFRLPAHSSRTADARALATPLD